MVEVDHELERRVIDRLHQAEPFGGSVDDVGFCAPQWLDRDGNATGGGQRRYPAAEFNQLTVRFLLAESVRDSPGAAAAEDDQADAHPRKPFERRRDVCRLLLGIDRWSGHFERRGQEQVRDWRGQPDGLDVENGPLEVGIGKGRKFGRGELDVVEPGGPRGSKILQRRAVADLNPGLTGGRGGDGHHRARTERGDPKTRNPGHDSGAGSSVGARAWTTARVMRYVVPAMAKTGR